MVVFPVLLCQMIAELAIADRRHPEARIRTRLVQCDGIERREHADVRQDRRIVLAMAIAIRRNIAYEIDVKARAVLAYRLRVLRHLAVEKIVRIPLLIADRIKAACADAAAAACAYGGVDERLVVLVADRMGATVLRALAAAAAEFRVHDALARRMLLHLACAASAAHSDVLDRTAEARRLVPLEMRKTDEDIGIHDGASDLRRLDILTVPDGDLDLVRSAQAITDEDLAARRDRVEPVKIRAVEMFQRMLAAAWIERIAVREERAPALLLDEIGDDLCVLRAEECHIAEFAKVHFDCDKLPIHIDRFDACCHAEAAQLHELARANRHAPIRKVDLRFLHDTLPIK